MEYSIFRECVCEEVKNILSEDFDVSLSENIKNNGISLWAINIKEHGTNVAPSIYLDDYYEKYKTTICDIKTIANDIIECYSRHKNDIEFDIDEFKDFHKIKNKIRCKLINKEENYGLLGNIPYIPFLDLAIVFYCVFNETSSYTQTCLINNSHLELWDVDLDTLKETGLNNTKKYGCFNFTAMNKIIAELFKQQLFEGEIYENEDVLKYLNDEASENNMYVLTNRHKMYGAIGMVFNDILEKFANILDNDLYIIPSSIHEVIIIPYTKNTNISEYNQIIEDVNMNNVLEEERLSGHIYLYKRDTNQVSIPISFD